MHLPKNEEEDEKVMGIPEKGQETNYNFK